MANKYETVNVQLPYHEYNILIGSGLLDQITSHVGPMLNRKRVAVITDTTISALYLTRLQQEFKNEMIDCDTLVLPCGEKSKSWNSWPGPLGKSPNPCLYFVRKSRDCCWFQ